MKNVESCITIKSRDLTAERRCDDYRTRSVWQILSLQEVRSWTFRYRVLGVSQGIGRISGGEDCSKEHI